MTPDFAPFRSRPTLHEVTFAAAAGVIETLEGPVRHEAGDAIITGVQGEQWPVEPHKFAERYTPCAGTLPGHPGAYTKTVREVRARQFQETGSVQLPNGKGELRAKQGDWHVEYGPGDESVVADEIFRLTYERLESSA